MSKLSLRDIAKRLSELSYRDFAEVFAYFENSTKYFEEEPDSRVTDEDILNLNANECGKIVKDYIVYAVMDILEKRKENDEK